MNKVDIDAIHTVELDMLKAFAALCDAHGLRYTIYCGTLLGAVRHKGFIPWDDDTDVAMPLKDYLRFQEISGELPERFSSVSYYSYPNSYVLWTRIVANKTTYMHVKTGVLDIPWGLYLDVYPFIGAARTRFGVKLQNLLLILVRRIRSAELYRAAGSRKILKRVLWHIPFPVRRAMSDCLLRVAMKDPEKSRRIGTIDAAPFEGKYDREDWTDMTVLPFEDGEFSAPAKYDKLLRIMYGDYMKLPPENKRIPHSMSYDEGNECIADTKKSYKQYRLELYGK